MCTSFRIKSEDKAIVVGRTMEFGVDLQSKLVVYPRNHKYTAQTPPNSIYPLSWEGKYGVVGPDAFGQEAISDGINEKGLYLGCLYLPGYAKYQEATEENSGKLISQLDVALYVLSMFATVEEVKSGMQSVPVWGMPFGELGIIPLHYSVHDASGNSIVLEYINGKLNIYDNPLGVLTNSPEFPWHLTNLSNFVNLSANNVPELSLQGDELKPIGEGSGMLGLPGDFTPPSRFVRAVALTQTAIPAKNAIDEVKVAFHILGSFDIPLGLTREKKGDKTYYEYTQWMSVSDITNTVYYFRTYTDPVVLKVDLKSLDFSSPGKKIIDVNTNPWFTDVSKTAVQP